MGQAPSAPKQEPKDEGYVGGPWEIAVVMMVGVTLVMSGYDNLTQEAYAFYLIWSRLTLMAIIGVIAHRIYYSWWFKTQVDAWNFVQEEKRRQRKINPGETDAPKKRAVSYWDLAGRAHPSAFLTTSLVQPRLFPFPTGLAAPIDSTSQNMVWESGLPPEIGRHQMGAEMSLKRREAYIKAISERISQEDKKKRQRKEFYENRRKHLRDRLWHLKVMSSIVVLAFLSRRLAILCIPPFLYSVFNSEITHILKGRPGVIIKKKRRPRAQKQLDRNYRVPDMGMGYLYTPAQDAATKKQGVHSLQMLPLIDAAPVLMTTSNERLASDGTKEKSIPTWFNYESKAMDDTVGVDGKRWNGDDD